MNITAVFAQAEKHGDFYMYYQKLRGKGTTYLVGTADFDNKYILAKSTDGVSGIPTGAMLSVYSATLQKQGKVLVFSWTNDKFRVLDAKDIRHVTPLSAELQRGKRNHR